MAALLLGVVALVVGLLTGVGRHPLDGAFNLCFFLAGLDVERADALRLAMIKAVAAGHAPVILDVVFTTIDDLAVPTTGMMVDQACASVRS